MTQERKLSIYVTEMPIDDMIGGKHVKRHHCALMLLDETNGRGVDAKVVQQLHFNNKSDTTMMPKVFPSITNGQVKELELQHYIDGNEDYIMPLWNHALKQAVFVMDRGVGFGMDYLTDPRDTNCRTGVKSAVEAMGMEFRKNAEGKKAGEDAYIDAFRVFDLDGWSGGPVDWREEHRNLTFTLTPEKHRMAGGELLRSIDF